MSNILPTKWCCLNSVVKWLHCSIKQSGCEKAALKSLELLFTEFLVQPFWVYGL